MTLAEMRGRVRYFIDEPTQQNFTDADINTALNVAQQHVALEIIQTNEDWFINPNPQTITIVPGTEAYALHTDGNGENDVLKIKRVEDALTGFTILPVDQNEKTVLPGIYNPIIVGGNPINFYLLGNYICFTPTPQLSGTVKYWFTPMLPDLVNDTDRSQIPRPFQDMIAVRASIDSFIKDESDISQLEAIYKDYMSRLQRTMRNRQIEDSRKVRRSADVKDPTIRYPNNIW